MEHPLLVVDDDLGGTEVDQSLETVVAVDDPAIEVVHVRRGETATVELDHRTEVRRNHRHCLEDHPCGIVLAIRERLDNFQTLLGPLSALLAPWVDQIFAKLLDFSLEIHAADEILDELSAHTAGVVLTVPVDDLSPELLGLDKFTRLHRLERVERFIEEIDLDLGTFVAVLDLALNLFLAGVDLVRLCAGVLHLGEFSLETLETGFTPLLEFLGDEDTLMTSCFFEIGKVLRALVCVYVRDEIGSEVDDLFELLRGHVEEIAEPARNTLEEPDVSHGCSELYVAHSLAAHLGPCDLNTAPLADDTTESHTLVLPAVALPIPRGTENTLVEEAVLLGLEGPVVDRFGLLDFAVRPGSDLV